MEKEQNRHSSGQHVGTCHPMGVLKTLRVYEASSETPGFRVLVDRLWPRGIRKDAIKLDEWAKEIAPSVALRTWFAHDESRFGEFATRYRMELDSSAEASAFAAVIGEKLRRGDVLLLYAARSAMCNHAVVLRDWLEEKCGHRGHHA